jgi:cell division protein FtsL
MNAAARALAENGFVSGSGRVFTFSSQALGVVLLVIALLASALAVVYIKDLNRQLFADSENLQQTRDTLHVEYGQLLLEQNTLAAPARVQAIAEQQLEMVIPTTNNIMVATNKQG